MGGPLTIVAGGPGLVASTTYDDLDPSMALAIWTSANGLTWRPVRIDPAVFPANANIIDIVSGRSGLVATGLLYNADGGSLGAMWMSTDGVQWRGVPDPDGVLNGAIMDAIVAGGPGYVAASGSELWTSTDGMSWRRVPDDLTVFANAQVSSLVDTGHGLLAVGTYHPFGSNQGYGAAWTSPDGSAWERVAGESALFGVGTAVFSVTVTPSGLIAQGVDFGSFDPLLWASSDGLTWKVLHTVGQGADGVVPHATLSLVFGSTGGDVSLWSLSSGWIWKREAEADAFGVGNCRVSDMIRFKDGLAAVGTCAAPPDLSPFIAAWDWTPRSSRPATGRTGNRDDPRAFTLGAAELPPGKQAQGRYVHLANPSVGFALGPYAAYRLDFGPEYSGGIPPQKRTMESLTIVARTESGAVHGMAVIGRLFASPIFDDQCAISRMQRPTLLSNPLRIGQRTKVFKTQTASCDTSESDTFGDTSRFPSRVVVWREGRYIGAVQVSSASPGTGGESLLKAAETYAHKLWMRERAAFGSHS